MCWVSCYSWSIMSPPLLYLRVSLKSPESTRCWILECPWSASCDESQSIFGVSWIYHVLNLRVPSEHPESSVCWVFEYPQSILRPPFAESKSSQNILTPPCVESLSFFLDHRCVESQCISTEPMVVLSSRLSSELTGMLSPRVFS